MNGNATAIENEAVKSVHFKIAKTAKMDCSLQNFGEKKILVRIQHNSARINGFIFFLSSFISSYWSIQFNSILITSMNVNCMFRFLAIVTNSHVRNYNPSSCWVFTRHCIAEFVVFSFSLWWRVSQVSFTRQDKWREGLLWNTSSRGLISESVSIFDLQ